MSCQPSVKSKTKSKKLKSRKSGNKTRSQAEGKSSTKCSENKDRQSTMDDSVNSAILKWNQEEPREHDPYEDGNYAKMPYEAPNEVNFVGGIGANIGHRRSKKMINRTTKIQEIYNMRNDNKTVFNFCEDPQLTSNLPLRRKKNSEGYDKLLKETVSRIGAIEHEQLPKKESSDPGIDTIQELKQNADSRIRLKESLVAENIAENKQNYLEIRQQYLNQKRILLKQKLETEVPQKLWDDYKKDKFKLSEYFDVDKNIPDYIDIESVREVVTDWSEKYKVEEHSCDLKFARPMPDVIAMPLERETLAFLTRTLDKPKNIEKLDEELRKHSRPVAENVTEDFAHRETARQLEKILRKQKAENFSIDLALKEFDDFMQNAFVFDVVSPQEDEKLDDTDITRREKVEAAMKDYEQKILHHLSESEESSEPQNISDEAVPGVTEDAEGYGKISLQQKINLPIDFTHAFDTCKGKIKCDDSETKESRRGQTLPNVSKSGLDVSTTKILKPETESKSKRKTKKNIEKSESICTNFTDDSGSYIIAQGKQLYLDRLKETKKIAAVDSGKATKNFDEYLRPYEVLPLKDAKNLNRRDPKLVPTFDIKDRLKVDIPPYDEDLIGVKNRKYLSQLATEWDEYYQKEILNRPRIRRFKPRTIIKQIVDSLRLKYESTYKREYLTEKSIVIEQEQLLTKKAEQFRDFCMAFFSNLTTTNYRQSMKRIQDLRPMYERNDELTSELTSLTNKLIQLKTAIIRAEGKAREATILQNVSYLMKEPTWREKNDWIHKKPDGSLETIKESIENRMITNLRKRDNDNVWAIKEFFENNIFENKRPALVCFKSPDEINETIANFKVQLCLSLLKLDLSTWTLMNLTNAYNSYIKWSSDFIANRKKYVEARCARKYFLDICAANMKKDAVELINDKLVETISEKTLRTLEPLCHTLYMSVIPKNIQEQLEGGDILSKFRLIISHAMSMLEQMDAIPSTKRTEIEKNIRKENGFIQRRTKRAVDLETHIDKVKKVMIKHSTPPFQRQPRKGKLPRSFLNIPKPKSEQIVKQSTESHDTVRLTITEKDFEKFLQDTPNQNDFYLDATFFGGEAEVPNMDFLPEMKSNLDEFIYDVKNLLEKWERNKQERYLEDAHQTWTTTFGDSDR